MTYNPQYTRPPKGNFDPDKAFSSVRAGTGAYLTEDETNEMQAILSEQTRDVVRDLWHNGLTDRLVALKDTTRTNVWRIAPFEVMVDGMKVRVSGINTTGSARTEADGADNLLLIPPPPADSETERYDPVLLEVFEEEVHSGQDIFKYGAQNSDFKLPNDLIDARIGAESSRRLQVQSVLRVVEDDTTDWKRDMNGGALSELETNVFRSETGRYVFWLCSLSYMPGHTGNAFLFDVASYTRMKEKAVPVIPTEKLADAAVTTPKIADGQVTFAKLAQGAVKSLQDVQGLVVPSGQGEYGFIPILRFFQWWSVSGNLVTADWPGGHSAREWGSQILQKDGEAWTVFEGLAYMSQKHGKWTDKNIHLMMGSSGALADNVSIYCMQNITSATASITPNAIYSSYGAQNSAASSSVAYKVFDPAGNPVLTADFTEYITTAGNSTVGSGGWTVQVPPGHVMMFVLKSSPVYSAGNLYYNHHGLRLSVSQIPSFKPHLPTYRRLLNGKWD